jgi:hypothetical protein
VDECFRLGKINLEGIGMVRNLVAEISEVVMVWKEVEEEGKDVEVYDVMILYPVVMEEKK